MGVFDDKKFEQLDWMVQVTETIDHPLNELLSQLPDRLEIDSSMFLSTLNDSWSSTKLELDQVVKSIINVTSANNENFRVLFNSTGWDERRLLDECYGWENLPESIEVDYETQTVTMSGPLIITKVKTQFSDEELIPVIADSSTMNMFSSRAEFDQTRMNEILDLLGGCEEALRSRSEKNKAKAIRERLKTILSTNEWRIRDATLAKKVCNWAGSYIQYGNMASFINFTKVKIMTHNNMPIYSIEEEK